MRMKGIVEKLPVSVRDELRAFLGRGVEEIRLRAGQAMEVRAGGESLLTKLKVDGELIRQALGLLSEHSLYAYEEELKQGFFTVDGGYRVGVAGRFQEGHGEVKNYHQITSLCIRVARAYPGCADPVIEHILREGRVLSALILSPPGFGKTTMLRDIARQLSLRGHRVAVSDDRGELAGRFDKGRYAMDLGPRTDVIEGIKKHLAIPMLVRAMAPEVIVTDELQRQEDAQAAFDAQRSGVSVIASAHGSSVEALSRRRVFEQVLREGLFDVLFILGGAPGRVQRIVHGPGVSAWTG